jgi:replicative DNA helicase
LADELRLTLKDSTPPHNLDAEEATLGCLLLDWDAVDKVSFLDPSRFYSRRNQVVFEGIRSLYTKGQTGDYRVLIEELKSRGTLEAAGGEGYIAGLPDRVPTAANVEYYARSVLDDSVRRELIKAAAAITAQAHDQTIPSRETLEEAQKRIFELTDLHNTHEIITMETVVGKTLDIIEVRSHSENKDGIIGIPSGIAGLDALTSGFHEQELIIIGARPSMGKTALALSMMQYIAVEKKIPTGFFSLEMSRVEIGQRMLSQVRQVPLEKLRTALLSPGQQQDLIDGASVLYEAPLFLVDAPNMTMLDIRALARNMVSNNGVKILFIDYIGLIAAENNSMERYLQVAEISRSLKSLARELNIPIVVLSQLNREAEKKDGGASLANISSSGAIEQDADLVMFISRKRDANEPTQEGTINLVKQRNGPTGDVKVLFIPQRAMFVNGTKDRD